MESSADLELDDVQIEQSKTWRGGRTRVSAMEMMRGAMVMLWEFRRLQQRKRQQLHAQGHQ